MLDDVFAVEMWNKTFFGLGKLDCPSNKGWIVPPRGGGDICMTGIFAAQQAAGPQRQSV